MTKICTKCGIEKPRTKEYFPLDKRCKDGLGSWCRECKALDDKNYYQQNKEKCCKTVKKYQKENKEKVEDYQKEYRQTFRGNVKRLVFNIQHRCNNPNNLAYKYYGGRGIKCEFTFDELYDWLVTENIGPRGLEIHRIDNDGDYSLGNIVFVTDSEHRQLHKNK